MDGDKLEIALLVVTLEEQGHVISYDHDDSKVIFERWKDLEPAKNKKGKKQKGKNCPVCFAQYGEKTMWCENCGPK